ncbi:MAG: hypothetical protein ACRDHP_06530 [Ktedonobacterales bacterium]
MQPVSSSASPVAGVAGGDAAPALRCPLCGKSTVPDALGFSECSCGWAGPGDPLESARGLGRTITQLDRRWATALVRKDLARMAAGKWRTDDLGALYTAALLLFATLMQVILAALLVGSAALTVSSFLGGAWLGFVVAAIVFLITLSSLFVARPRANGIEATRERFPSLFVALDEAGAKVGAPLPQHVILVPAAEVYSFSHRPARRLFRRQVVLALGVGALPLLDETDLKAFLARELARYGNGRIAFAPYYRQAEEVLRHIFQVMLEALGAQTTRRPGGYSRRAMRAGSIAGMAQFSGIIVWILTLPLQIVVILYHLLRLKEIRAAEFDVDRAAALAYGPQAFGNGLTGLRVAANTMRGSASSLLVEMSKRGERNFYAQLRQHYSELPPAILYKLRIDGAREFRSVERTPVCIVDRLRAGYTVPFAASQPQLAPVSAVTLLTPAGEADASSVELALTERLFARSSAQQAQAKRTERRR